MLAVKTKPPSFEDMAGIWKSGGDLKSPYNISALTSELRKFGLNVNQDGEQILIFGTRNIRKQLWEDLEGQLIAVAPGVIICNISFSGAARYCTGLLERSDGNYYEVKVFASVNGEHIYGNASINIGPGPVDYREAAAVFYWGFGRDEGSSLGITPERWAVMHPWIERWLGPAK